MKKWLIGIVVFFMIATALTYLLIPNIIRFTGRLLITTSEQGFLRNIYDEKSWYKWWPGNHTTKSDGTLVPVFSYNDFKYTINDEKISSLTLSISDRSNVGKSAITFITIKPDSITLFCETALPTSYNPINRLGYYFKSKRLKKDITDIMKAMQGFYSKAENIYGISIRQESVVDSILTFTYATSKEYPSTSFIYDLVDELKNYIKNQSANETGSPMLNVSNRDSSGYLVRVAIPVDKRLPSAGKISYKWMLGGGKILTTEIKGGIEATNKASAQMDNYVNDYHLSAPAIPFLSLITDRRKEPDSSKWVSKLYYPIM